jgi:enamine deaminase RidA (YjgF/YER057c/UK114 family)
MVHLVLVRTPAVMSSRAKQERDMKIQKRAAREAAYFGVPWESAFGYPQAVKVGGVIYVSGQLSHDERGNLVGPATLDGAGKVVDSSNMGPANADHV